jgi:hypothetical protein
MNEVLAALLFAVAVAGACWGIGWTLQRMATKGVLAALLLSVAVVGGGWGMWREVQRVTTQQQKEQNLRFCLSSVDQRG